MPMKLEAVLELLGVTAPFQDSPLQLDQLRRWVDKWVEEKGENWVRENRQRILKQWEALNGRLK